LCVFFFFFFFFALLENLEPLLIRLRILLHIHHIYKKISRPWFEALSLEPMVVQ
jgi:hypothetical protein